MHDHFYGHGYGVDGDGGFGAPHSTGHALVMALFMMLPWLILAGLGAWALYRTMATRGGPATEAMAEPESPSAVEILCQRYVRGQIDVMTFEEMLDRILSAEHREHATLPSLTRTPSQDWPPAEPLSPSTPERTYVPWPSW